MASSVPQDMPLDDRQVENSAGGYVYELDDIGRLRRFLILGMEGGSYYASQPQLKYENAQCVVRLLDAGKGAQVVAEVAEISEQGRAPKQSTGIFVLAMCARLGDKATRQAAMQAVPRVCRTASTLFEFVEHCKGLGGVAVAVADAAKTNAADAAEDGGQPRSKRPSWGRAMRRAVAHWYLDRDPVALAYQVTKYSQRSGWSHADLLRLAHPDANTHAAKRFGAGGKGADAAAAEGNKPTAGTTPMGDSLEGADEEADDGAALALATAALPASGEAAAAAWLADMRSIFAYLTHGSLPGQPEAQRGNASLKGTINKRKADAAPEGAPAPTPAAGSDTAMADADAASPAPPAPAVPVRPSGLSPVMQYIVDADYLRKQLKAPPPYKPPKPEGEAAAKAGAEAGGGTEEEEEAAGGRHRKGKGCGKGRQARQRGKGKGEAKEEEGELPADQAKARAAVKEALRAAVEEACALVRRHRFGHEHVGDTQLLKQPALWATFLEVGMPMTALVRNLGRLSALGVLDSQEALGRVTRVLRSPQAVRKARLHPLTLLGALRTYSTGHGTLGSLSWEPKQEVKEALEEAFYLAFENVEATGKRYLAGLDVSGSMGAAPCTGIKDLTARDASAAMLMAFVRREPSLVTMAFGHTFHSISLKKEDTLDQVIDAVSSLPFGSTDCALPMLYALEKKLQVDVFLVYTDNETYHGKVHPTEALKRYRREMGIDAKLIVFGCSATSFTIADPSDPGMLDVVGMDSAVPRLVADFVLGKV